MSEEQTPLLAVVAEDRVTALLSRADDGFLLETIVWPAVWGARGRFTRILTVAEARAWLGGHGLTEVEL